MTVNHLYPVVIPLSDINFSKIDVGVDSATLVASDFAIMNYGSITDFSITVDRTSQSVIKSVNESNIVPNGQGGSFYTSDTGGNLPNFVTLNTNYTNSTFHPNFTNNSEDDPKQLLRGAVFCLIVKQIFSQTDVATIDFTLPENRYNNIFFLGDSTTGVLSDIVSKTYNDLDKTITQSASPGEFHYWNVRTIHSGGFETEDISMNNGDKLYIYYTISLNFESNGDNTFQDTTLNSSFALSWNLYKTGDETITTP